MPAKTFFSRRKPPEITRLTFSPDGRRLIVTGDTEAALIDVASNQLLPFPRLGSWPAVHEPKSRRSVPESLPVTDIAFDPRGQLIATGSPDRTIRFWSADSLRPLDTVLPLTATPRRLTFSPDGQALLVRTEVDFQVWDYRRQRPIGQRLAWSRQAHWLSPDRLLTVGSTTNVWQRPVGRRARPPIRHWTEWIAKVAFWPDDETLTVVDASSITGYGQPGFAWRPYPGMRVYAADFAANADRFVLFRSLVFNKGTPWLTGEFEFASRSPVAPGKRYPTPPGTLFPLAIRHDGRRAVICDPQRLESQLWDALEARPHGVPQTHPSPVRAVCFHPSGASYVTLGHDGAVRRFHGETGAFLGTLVEDTPNSVALAFSGDGQVLATVGLVELRLWSAETGQPAGRVLSHPTMLTTVELSPDGRLAVTGGHDGGIRVWDGATGERLGPALWHATVVRQMAISRDGRQLLSASDDGQVSLWNLVQPLAAPPVELTRRVQRLIGKELNHDGALLPFSGSASSKPAFPAPQPAPAADARVP